MLQKRQAILVGLMILALCYAAFDLLSGKSGTPAPGRPGVEDARQEAARTVQAARQMLEKTPMSEVEQYRVDLLRREPAPSPFYVSDGEFYFPGSSGVAEGDGLSYKGFVRAGDRLLAVISGAEYAVGEEIEGTGFVLSSIQPSYVELVRKDGNGRVGARKLPLVEDPVKTVDVKVGR
ncbi:hypothetical protein [Desulfovibrio sp.]